MIMRDCLTDEFINFVSHTKSHTQISQYAIGGRFNEQVPCNDTYLKTHLSENMFF